MSPSWMVTVRRPGDDEGGSVLILAIGGMLLVLFAILVLADASMLFLRRTALLSIAETSALRAATAIDVEALYNDPIGSDLTLDPTLAAALATEAVAENADPHLRDIRTESVRVTPPTVTVTLTAAADTPLSGLFPDGTRRITVAATARTPTRF